MRPLPRSGRSRAVTLKRQARDAPAAWTTNPNGMKKTFGRIVDFIQVGMWRISPKDVPPLAKLPFGVLKRLVLAIRFFVTQHTMQAAAALTYSTLLAIVPIFAVVFAIARGFGYNKYIEDWFRETFISQPQAAEAIIGFVNSYLVHTKSGVFLGIGLIIMLYTVLLLTTNVENAFNEIWQVKKRRSIFRTFTDYLAMLLLFPIIVVLTSGLSIFMATTVDSLPDALLLAPVAHLLLDLSPYVLMSLMFIGLYVFMPNTRVHVRNAVVPGILAGVAMQWFQLFYINSQIWVSSYNAIYGSFAALPLFMLWAQISWTICLFGAELCYVNQNLEYYDYNTKTSDISHRYKMMLSSILLGCICKRFDQGLSPLSAVELREATGIPIRIVNDLLSDLLDAGLVVVILGGEKGRQPRYMPAETVERMSVGMMVDRLESKGQWKIDFTLRAHYGEAMRRAMELRSDYLQRARDILLKDF